MEGRRFMTLMALAGTCFVVLNLFPMPAGAAEFKAAQVHLSSVTNNSARFKVHTEFVRSLRAESGPKVKVLADEVKRIETELKKGKDSMGEDQKKKLEADMKSKIEELQSEQDNLMAKVRFAQESFKNVFQTQIQEVIAKIAKEEGVTVVFRKEFLLYSEPVVDITEKVTKAFDDMPALEKGPEK